MIDHWHLHILLHIYRHQHSVDEDIKPTTFITTFATSADGNIKSKSTKITDNEGVLIEEVLSEPEESVVKGDADVLIEEVKEDVEGSWKFANWLF